NAKDCFGLIDGNPAGDTVWADKGWTMLAKVDDGGSEPGTVEGIEFTLTAEDIGDKSGTWQLAWEEVGEPGFDLTLDVVANLKASNSSASYLFEELTFTADGSGQGEWEIKFVNGGDQTPVLSNMTLWYKISDDGRDLDPVPEPSTVLLMGLGFLGFGASRLKAKKS
ncbi:MAG: PEP-CTERM sorting domain-containing protein, partial [Methylomicrobium sp.]|nr:PEP-CTERM sorting domain-containing protein [Methylomicrobium sp.]